MNHDSDGSFGAEHPFSDGVCAEYANTVITYSIMLAHREIEVRSPCAGVASDRLRRIEGRLAAMAAEHVASITKLCDTVINTAPDGTVPASN